MPNRPPFANPPEGKKICRFSGFERKWDCRAIRSAREDGGCRVRRAKGDGSRLPLAPPPRLLSEEEDDDRPGSLAALSRGPEAQRVDPAAVRSRSAFRRQIPRFPRVNLARARARARADAGGSFREIVQEEGYALVERRVIEELSVTRNLSGI